MPASFINELPTASSSNTSRASSSSSSSSTLPHASSSVIPSTSSSTLPSPSSNALPSTSSYILPSSSSSTLPSTSSSALPIASSSSLPNEVPPTNGTARTDASVASGNADRPCRQTKAPSYLQNYHCALLQSHSSSIPLTHTTPYPLSSVLSYAKIKPHYKAFILSYSLETEPKNFHEAMSSDRWKKAVNMELHAMEENGTWYVVSLPPGKNVVGCKWVFTIKFNADGTVERYKGRLVAKGFIQQEGVDYNETFSPVIKLTSVKLMLGLAAIKGWTLTQMDVSNAFLHSTLDEEINMSLPQGYTPPDGVILPPNAVCRLYKSLYGLKQASRQWNQTFTNVLLKVATLSLSLTQVCL